MKKVLLVLDCHYKLISGVNRKHCEIKKKLKEMNIDCKTISPDNFWTFNIPYWNEFKMTFITPYSYYKIINEIESYDPNNISIMTEGTLGFMTSIHCFLTGRNYTTMRCTRIEDYFDNIIIRKVIQGYFYLFHFFSECCITPSLELSKIYKHKNCVGIANGCNLSNFNIYGEKYDDINKYDKPLWLFVGRIVKEKNIDELIRLKNKIPGTIITCGDGPEMHKLKKAGIVSLGWKDTEELSKIYRSCDIFIFPSVTDTFGQVMVEAMASGLPVAAYKTTGPNDVVLHNKTGYLSENLEKSCNNVLKMIQNDDKIKDYCVEHSKTFTWENMVKDFLHNQVDSKRKYYCVYQLLTFMFLLLYIQLSFHS